MTAISANTPILQFFGNNNLMLAGGSLLTQVSGINQATYQDSALTIPLPNPIPLNSRGEISNAIGASQQLYLTPNIIYTFTLYDPNGNQIWQEPVSGSISSGSLSFIAAGTGAVTRTVQGKERDTVSVADYGADPTGVADSTSAFNLAITASNSVRIPAGNYKVTASITNTISPVNLIGDGPAAVTITPSGNFDVFSFTASGEGAGLTGVTINAAGMTGGNCVNVTGSDRTRFNNILILSPYNGFYIKKTNACYISDVWLNGATGAYCVNWVGDNSNRSDVLDIDNVQVSSAGSASSTSAVGIIMDGNVNTLDIRHFAGVNMSRGILVQNTAGGSAPQFITAYDVQIDFPYYEGIKLGASIRTCLFTDMYLHGSVTADNFYADSTVQHVSWQGGKNDSAYQRGGYLDSRYTTIANVQTSTNSQAGSGIWPGWEIGPDSIGNLIIGGLAGQFIGYATEKQSYGVQIDAGAQGYRVIGVDLRGNVTGDYNDLANDPTSQIFANTNTATPHKISGPIQSMSGSLRLNSVGTNVVNIGNVTNGIGLQVTASDASTINNIAIFGHAGNSSPAIGAVSNTTADLDIVLVPKGAGVLQPDNAASFSANGSVATVLGSIGPAGANTTVQKWLTIKDNGGTLRYIPCF